jgi:hypothetical protein
MNQQTSKEKVIGGKTYQVRMLPAGLGLRSAARLINLVGPGVQALQSGDSDAMMSFSSGLMTNEKLADQLEWFTSLFAKYTAVQVEPSGGFVELSTIYEVHFMGNYFELLQWLVFCFEGNHASFLGASGVSVQNLVALIERELRSRSQKRAGKPGSSGGLSSPESSTKPTAT